MIRNAGWLVAMVLVAGLVGCSEKAEMVPRDVRVTLDDSLRDKQGKLNSVQVDMIAVNSLDLERWRSASVEEYWGSGSSLAASSAKYTLKFNYEENVSSKVLSKNDPIWKKWEQNNAMDLVVVASIPGLVGRGEGSQDPRRLIITLDKRRWDDLGELKVIASRGGISTPNQPKPPVK